MMIVTIEIDQYGEGHTIYPIYKLHIGNLEEVQNLGFGNVICNYVIQLYKTIPSTLREEDEDEWELIHTDYITHNRRDGAVELVRKATELMKDRA